LVEMRHAEAGASLSHILQPALMPSVLGAVFAFLAGLLALKWLSRWLEAGKWHYFGIYCLAAAAVVAYLHHAGF